MGKMLETFLALLLLAAACGKTTVTVVAPPSPSQTTTTPPLVTPPTPTPPPAATTIGPSLALPITNALSRVTKKTFGLYVSPGHSPVSPERFTGYHTGADFETTPDEQNNDVPIYAICDGQLLMKKWASGYGGVAVESCTINNNPVTIIYGHLRESSISPNIGDVMNAGKQIAVLGTGYSQETDGERKHLHLGIHKGSSINILGYVQKQSELSSWTDPLLVLK